MRFRELKTFCARRSSRNPDLSKPWRAGNYLCASDGKMMIAVPSSLVQPSLREAWINNEPVETATLDWSGNYSRRQIPRRAWKQLAQGKRYKGLLFEPSRLKKILALPGSRIWVGKDGILDEWNDRVILRCEWAEGLAFLVGSVLHERRKDWVSA